MPEDIRTTSVLDVLFGELSLQRNICLVDLASIKLSGGSEF